ncbi:MAG: L-sorbose 1-phosphate reductase, partial [Clostridiales bacterium]|nr:L-sorbose 1-phosphate reductase [Clostridiales bacterium]
PKIPGGKKLIYPHIALPLTAIADFGKLGETDEMFKELGRLCSANNGLWSPAAEAYLLANAQPIA